MITIDYALRVYTDMLIDSDDIDMTYFQSNLSVEDFEEFKELIQFINILKASKANEQFQKIFDKVDAHKETIYNLPSVANFRARHDSDSANAIEKLNQIFDEEFSDE